MKIFYRVIVIFSSTLSNLPFIFDNNDTSDTSLGKFAILSLTISSEEAILISKSCIAFMSSSGSGGSPAGVLGLRWTCVSTEPSEC